MPLPWLSYERRKAPASPVEAFDDDVQELAKIGIKSIVASLDLPLQRQIFENCGFKYFSLPIPDGCPPTEAQAVRMLHFYDFCPLPLCVHCEGGIGRTGTLLAIILLHRGVPVDEAVLMVKRGNPLALENGRQLQFVYNFSRHFKPKK